DTVADVVWLDDHTLAAAQRDRVISIWDLPSGKQTSALQGHSGPVQCLAISPDRKLLCSGAADHAIRVWEIPSRRLLRSLDQHLGPVQALAFRPAFGGPAILASAS